MRTFDEFLDGELDSLARYAAALTGDRDRAHEVLADALEKAQRQWDRIAPMQYPAAYVRRMVSSIFVSQHRRWASRMIRPTRSGRLPDRTTADPTAAVDDRAAMLPRLAALPPRQRAVVVLRYYAGMHNNEIATELGVSSGAVRTAHSVAMRTLRVTIDDAALNRDAQQQPGRGKHVPTQRPTNPPEQAPRWPATATPGTSSSLFATETQESP